MTGALPPVVDRSNLEGRLAQMLASAQSVPRERQVIRFVAPAGIPIEVSFDDGGLAEAYCRWLPIAPPGSSPQARIHVITGRRAPVPEWTDSSFAPADFHAAAAAEGIRAAYPFQSRLWKLFDTKTKIGVQMSPSVDDLPPWDGAAPLRQHMHWLLDGMGWRLAHAATLGWRDRGVVLFGKGGSGKSGTTLAGLAAGLSTAGDDYVALKGSGAPVARELFRVVKQDRAGLALNDALAGTTTHLVENWRGKMEFDPAEFFDGARIDEIALKAVVMPRIAHAESPSLVPIDRQSVMLALMTSNLHQFAGEPDNGVSFFASFLKKLPCFRMDLSPSAAKNGAVLRDFIDALPAEPAVQQAAAHPASA